MKLNNLQSDLIIGSLLGDGNMSTTNGQTWRFRVLHKMAHEAYVFHKYGILKEFCNTPPKSSTFIDSRTGKQYFRTSFNTLVTDDFRYYGQLFYKLHTDGSWKKKVPANIESLLTPRALAYWYMDDGALKWANKSNAVRLCTDSFSLEDVNRLKFALENKFSLDLSLQSKGDIKRLCILEKSYPVLKDLIAEYLIPSMYYKFPDGNKGIYGSGQDISNEIYNRMDIPKDENAPDLIELDDFIELEKKKDK